MTILLDTCALLWYATDWDQYSPAARRAMSDPKNELAVSAFSAFEIGYLEKRGRIKLEQDARSWFEAILKIGSIRALPVTWEIAMASTTLPPVHADPADRMIVATAQAFQLPIVTPDAQIAAYPSVNIIW